MAHKCKILIIDDEEVIIASVKKICELNGFDCDAGREAASALELIGSKEYCLIICDIMMPGMDGFQFLEELRNRNIETAVMMTTGYSTIENAVKSLHLGAIDFIPKPFSFDELTNFIKRGLNYSRLQKIKSENEGALIYVPCPPKYFRFGYSCWVNYNFDGTALVGASDLFIKTLDGIKKLELLDAGENVNQAMPIAKFIGENESVHQLYSAVSGRIIEVNTKLINEISLLEKDPYFEGWIYRLIPSQWDYEMQLLTSCSSDR